MDFADNGGVSLYGSLGEYTLTERIVAGLVQTWAETSGDSHDIALMLQRAVAEVFELDWPPGGYKLTTTKLAAVEDLHERWKDITTTFVRSMYENTQSQLDLMYPGQDYIRLVRGFTADASAGLGDSFQQARNAARLDDVVLNPASSFSLDVGTSTRFGPTMLYVDVPKDRILGTPLSGYGCLGEWEYVVLGAPSPEQMAVIGRQYAEFNS